MHMKVEYVLACCFAVLLNNADAVSFGGFFDGCRNLFGDSVNLAELVHWGIKDVNVMSLWYNKCVPQV